MILWPCFVCGSEVLCAHREPELMIWLRSGGAVPPVVRPFKADIPRKPVVAEVKPIQPMIPQRLLKRV